MNLTESEQVLESLSVQGGCIVNTKIVAIICALVGSALTAACVPSTAPTATPAPKPGAAQPVAHVPGTVHTEQQQPKRLETVSEIDMGEFYFATPDGTKNPVFRLSVGKTIGLHLHSDGAVLHEVVLGRGPLEFAETDVGGRKVAVPEGYSTNLFKEIEADVFFYYGDVKAEVGGANFGEIEMDPGLQNTWIRFKVPETLKGEWELGCFAPGHYEAGMHAKVIID
jgi:uncharacterized cupredoxin-like copper-binding protein